MFDWPLFLQAVFHSSFVSLGRRMLTQDVPASVFIRRKSFCSLYNFSISLSKQVNQYWRWDFSQFLAIFTQSNNLLVNIFTVSLFLVLRANPKGEVYLINAFSVPTATSSYCLQKEIQNRLRPELKVTINATITQKYLLYTMKNIVPRVIED